MPFLPRADHFKATNRAGIKDYFDESDEKDLKQLNDFLDEYAESIDTIPDISVFEVNAKLDSFKKEFELKYNSLIKIYTDNKKLIENKKRNTQHTSFVERIDKGHSGTHVNY